MREEKCTWRVEIAKLMKSIGQDDLALEHIAEVMKELPTINFTTVEKETFETSVSELEKELKERI